VRIRLAEAAEKPKADPDPEGLSAPIGVKKSESQPGATLKVPNGHVGQELILLIEL
jgi:hypothetical protein